MSLGRMLVALGIHSKVLVKRVLNIDDFCLHRNLSWNWFNSRQLMLQSSKTSHRDIQNEFTFQEQKSGVILTSKEPIIFRMLFSTKNQKIGCSKPPLMGQKTRHLQEMLTLHVKVRIFWEGHNIWKNLPLRIWRYSVTENALRRMLKSSLTSVLKICIKLE